MGMTNNPLYRRCGAEDETSADIFCCCEALASLRYVYLCSFFLDPEDIKRLSMGPSGTLAKEQSTPELVLDYGAERSC